MRPRIIFSHRGMRNKQAEIRVEKIRKKISIKWKINGKRRKQNQRYKNRQNKQRKEKYFSAFSILTEIICIWPALFYSRGERSSVICLPNLPVELN
jgi:hypothetical protein